MRHSLALLLLPLLGLAAEHNHAFIINNLDAPALTRGQAVYERDCQICHGTKDTAGALPMAMRFAEGQFKNGNQPHAMYQTIKDGLGLFMPPNPSLSHQQIHDVAHYIRETFVKPFNESQYFPVTEAYLASLDPKPLGKQNTRQPHYLTMDYGPTLTATYGVGPYSVMKGIACRLDQGVGGVTKGKSWMLFDQDTLQPAAGWHGTFSNYTIITMTGHRTPDDRHQLLSNIDYVLPNEPAWANPQNDSFADERFIGRDGKRYGPLPYAWGRFEGVHRHQKDAVIQYRIGERRILAKYGTLGPGIYEKTLHVGSGPHALIHRIAPLAIPIKVWATAGAEISKDDRYHLLAIAPQSTVRVSIALNPKNSKALDAIEKTPEEIADLSLLTTPTDGLWKLPIKTAVIRHADSATYVGDEIVLPHKNPWFSKMRMGGLDFFKDANTGAICTWDGDVWLFSGILGEEVTWRRFASGLFQPLGLRVVNEEIYVTCRDQVALLKDTNKDGEADFIQAFNSDHQVTTHWHEFTTGLDVDKQGRFYYAKAGRHSSPALIEHHGTVIRVDADGKSSDVIATGFRAPNSTCVNDDGTLYVSDQEGNWVPENRINLITPKADNPDFFGFYLGYHARGEAAQEDSAMTLPMLWVHRNVDRSPAELLHVKSTQWGPLNGGLISLSYGYGKVYNIFSDTVNGHKQGGIVELNVQFRGKNHFPTGIMRGRFNPQDGQLYTCGLSDWATSRTSAHGGFYKVRYTGQDFYTPVTIHNHENGLLIHFGSEIKGVDLQAGSRLVSWILKRSSAYGMRKLKTPINEIPLTRIHLLDEGRSAFIECELKPSWMTELDLNIIKPDGGRFQVKLENTIYDLRSAFELPAAE